MDRSKYVAGLVLLALTPSAMAYIGPGAGVSFLGSFFSVVLVILLTVGVVLFWPVRYLWRRLKRRPQQIPPEPALEAQQKPD